MFEDNKNLKDSHQDSKNNSIKDTSVSIPTQYPTTGSISVLYTKTNKLITALYMVTDIIDINEPIRNKLRALGVEIVSDMRSIQDNNIGHLASILCSKIAQVMSFLELASTINIISEMNGSILKKEFIELDKSIKDSIGNIDSRINRKINLTEFFSQSVNKEEELGASTSSNRLFTKPHYSIGHTIGHHSNGQHRSARIGVQKGSTLLKALSDKLNSDVQRPTTSTTHAHDFNILKKKRREDIKNILKTIGGSSTIKDIKDKIKTIGQSSSLISCGEKTLQRELVSMVKDGFLNKTGEKRWSKYFLK